MMCGFLTRHQVIYYIRRNTFGGCEIRGGCTQCSFKTQQYRSKHKGWWSIGIPWDLFGVDDPKPKAG
jgi:hypothetical protein